MANTFGATILTTNKIKTILSLSYVNQSNFKISPGDSN